jgi:hypothetical protein
MDSGIIKRPFKWDGGKLAMSAGDAFTVPMGLIRFHHNAPSTDVITFVIRGAATPVLAEQSEADE